MCVMTAVLELRDLAAILYFVPFASHVPGYSLLVTL